MEDLRTHGFQRGTVPGKNICIAYRIATLREGRIRGADALGPPCAAWGLQGPAATAHPSRN